MTTPGKFTGRVANNPEAAAQAAERQSRLLASLEDFATRLKSGITQSAPKTQNHRQNDNRACFYASLLGVRRALRPELSPVSENLITEQAERAGLLGRYGAETWPEFQASQSDFVCSRLGLEIRFIDQRKDAARIEALTTGLLNKGEPVIFGTLNHWIALDGFVKQGESLSWIGMDPASGQRLEETGRSLDVLTVFDRLLYSGMPLVVVEDSFEPSPRFQPADKVAVKRFQPAARKVIGIANQPPRFAPTHKQ